MKDVCKKCGKPIKNSKSGYCKQHSPLMGSYVRTEKLKEEMSSAVKNSEKYKKAAAKFKGRKLPKTSVKLKKWWDEHPEQKEKLSKKISEKWKDAKYVQKVLAALPRGEENHQWKGGVSNQKDYVGFTKGLKRKIREMDNNTCQLCGITHKGVEDNLSVHHIDYDKSNPAEDNLITLCKKCNSLVNIGRESWTNHFQEKILERRRKG